MMYRILRAVTLMLHNGGDSIVINTKIFSKASGDGSCILIVVYSSESTYFLERISGWVFSDPASIPREKLRHSQHCKETLHGTASSHAIYPCSDDFRWARRGGNHLKIPHSLSDYLTQGPVAFLGSLNLNAIQTLCKRRHDIRPQVPVHYPACRTWVILQGTM